MVFIQILLRSNFKRDKKKVFFYEFTWENFEFTLQ